MKSVRLTSNTQDSLPSPLLLISEAKSQLRKILYVTLRFPSFHKVFEFCLQLLYEVNKAKRKVYGVTAVKQFVASCYITSVFQNTASHILVYSHVISVIFFFWGGRVLDILEFLLEVHIFVTYKG